MKDELIIDDDGGTRFPSSVCPEHLLDIHTDGESFLAVNPDAPVMEIKDADSNILFAQYGDGTMRFRDSDLGIRGDVIAEPVSIGPIAKPPDPIHFSPPYSELVARIVALEKAVVILAGDTDEN